MNEILQVRGLSKRVPMGDGELDILRGVDIQVNRGEFIAIMGPSGSGKSTLLGLVAGLDACSGGEVFIDGTEITRLSEDRLARLRGQKVGYIFQSFNLISTLTALENVELPMTLVGKGGKPRPRAKELLHRVGLDHRMNHYPAQLSGGEQQRVAIARAFACEPLLMLADEPTGNLDTVNGELVLNLLLQLNREQGTTLVVVTHDSGIAKHADRTIHLRDGQVVREEVRENVAV